MKVQVYRWDEKSVENTLLWLNSNTKSTSLGISAKSGLRKIGPFERFIQWILPCCMIQRTSSKYVIPRIISLFEHMLKEQNGKNYFPMLYAKRYDWKKLDVLLDRVKKNSQSYDLSNEDDKIVLKIESELRSWSDPQKDFEKKHEVTMGQLQENQTQIDELKSMLHALQNQ